MSVQSLPKSFMKSKIVSIKTLMKHKYLITKFSGKCKAFLQRHIWELYSHKKIHETFPEIIPGSFYFEQVSNDIITKEIRSLNVKKSSAYGSILASILKQCVDAYLPYLTVSINYFLRQNTFPGELTYSWYKKLDPPKKENYITVTLPPHVSKVFERIIYQQIITYMEDKLPKCLTAFRNSHGT